MVGLLFIEVINNNMLFEHGRGFAPSAGCHIFSRSGASIAE
jgi:hypothetical protein